MGAKVGVQEAGRRREFRQRRLTLFPFSSYSFRGNACSFLENAPSFLANAPSLVYYLLQPRQLILLCSRDMLRPRPTGSIHKARLGLTG